MEDRTQITDRDQSVERRETIFHAAALLVDQIIDRGTEIAAKESEMDVKEHSKKEKRKRKRGRVRRNKKNGCEKSVDISHVVSYRDLEGEPIDVCNEKGTGIEDVNETRAKVVTTGPNFVTVNETCPNVSNDLSSVEKLNEMEIITLTAKRGTAKTAPNPGRRKNSVPKPKFTQRSWLDDDEDTGEVSETDELLSVNDKVIGVRKENNYAFVPPVVSCVETRDLDVRDCVSSSILVTEDSSTENRVQSSTKLNDSIVSSNENVKVLDRFDVRINEKCQKMQDGKNVEKMAIEKVDQNKGKREVKPVIDPQCSSKALRITSKKELFSNKNSNSKIKKNNNFVPLLDSDDEDNEEADLPVSKSLPAVLQDHTSIQLNAYKNRFTGCSNTQNFEQCNMNNAVCVKKDVDVKIGVNVNDLKDDRSDKIKRSRRKTEPFDFELQSDGDMTKSNKFKYEKPGFVTSGNNDKPNFVNNSNHEKPSFVNHEKTGNNNYSNNFSGSDKTRNLFSGFISDAGVFVPTSNMDKRSSRDSLDRIFDEECSEDDSLDDYEVDFDDGDGSESGNGSSDCRSESEDEALPPEPQLGNVEYKLKLVTPTKQRFEHLVTQMKWRLREGRGEALYEIGVRDCGRVRGLSSRELRASLRTLRRMAARLGAACALLTRGRVPGNPKRERAEVLVRKIPDDQHNIEVRVAVMGSNDAGKSTLVGVLTQGELDNGRGRARLNMFRHLHEVRTGRTSSVSHEILGFDPQGHPINYAYSELMTSEEIAERSSKLVSFIDLAGHRKYLKTTVQGLTGYSPHYAMLVVSATAGINQMTLEHLALVTALDLPFFIAVTKIDSTPPDKVIEALRQALNTIGCRKVPLPVLTQDDVILAASNALSRVAVPVFPVSSVSGCGLDTLGWFLFLAPPAMATCERDRLEQEPVEFQIDETFKVGGTSGPVVGGLLTKGVLTERTKLLIGPLDSGDFVPITVISLHRNKAPCRVVRAGQAASLGLSVRPPTLRQGMVILAIPDGYQGQHDLIKTPVSPQPKIGIENGKDRNVHVKETKVSNQSEKNKVASEGKQSNLKIRQEDIVEIVDGIGAKGVADDVNLVKRSIDDGDKLMRLSPSRYTSRFVSSFGNTAAIPSASVDLDIDSIEGFDDEPNENETKPPEKEEEIRTESCKVVDLSAEDIDEGILKEDPNNPRGCYCFQATVSVLYHSTAIYPGFQATVHIGNIRQTAVIEGILAANSVLRAKDRAPVVFRFVRHPEYVKTGAHLLFREGLHTKGVGVVTQVFPHASPEAAPHDK